MKKTSPVLPCALAFLVVAAPSGLRAQDVSAEIRSRIEAARTAAGREHAYYFSLVCSVPIRVVGAAPAETSRIPTALPSMDPDRDWYAEPVQVFDDLFFLGQTAYSVWGLRTSEGIILVDAIFDYSVEAEVIEGLKKLGIDPGEIRYVIISHAHGDHSAGAGILQKQYGARVIMSAADWDLYESSGREPIKATRDIVATDGMELPLGDHTVRIYLTPGHTRGTISTILPIHDNGQPHVAAVWGGTLFNFRDAPGDPRDERLGMYAESARRFRDVARDAGVDVLLSNHTVYDVSTLKMPALMLRRPGERHPYVIGAESINRFLTVAEECAVATRLAERPRV